MARQDPSTIADFQKRLCRRGLPSSRRASFEKTVHAVSAFVENTSALAASYEGAVSRSVATTSGPPSLSESASSSSVSGSESRFAHGVESLLKHAKLCIQENDPTLPVTHSERKKLEDARQQGL